MGVFLGLLHGASQRHYKFREKGGQKRVLDPIWSLLIASALGVIGGLIPYKLFVSHLAASSSEEEFFARREQAYHRFAIRYFIAQVIPFLFLGYGMYIILTEGSASTGVTDVIPFLVAAVFIALVGGFSVYLTTSPFLRDPHFSAEMRNLMKNARLIGYALITAIPEVCIGFFVMILIGLV